MSEEPGRYVTHPQSEDKKTTRIYKDGKDISEETHAAIAQRKHLFQAFDTYLNGIRGRAKRALATSTFDPKLLFHLLEIGEILIECCDGSFEDFVREMVSFTGDEIRPFLKGIYEQIRYAPGTDFAETMTPPQDVASIDVNSIGVS